MNYELVKQLNEAGWDICLQDNSGKPVTYPTLSELIEACGEGFRKVEKMEGEWDAWDWYGAYGNGKTPEEAVAKLWLELNKK